MIVEIESFGEDAILDRDIDSRELLAISFFVAGIDVAVHGHHLIQSPRSGAVVVDDIANTIAATRIIAEGYIHRAATEAHIADDDIVCVDEQCLSSDDDAVAWCGLAINGDIRGTDMDRSFEMDLTSYIEYDDAGASCLAGFA